MALEFTHEEEDGKLEASPFAKSAGPKCPPKWLTKFTQKAGFEFCMKIP